MKSLYSVFVLSLIVLLISSCSKDNCDEYEDYSAISNQIYEWLPDFTEDQLVKIYTETGDTIMSNFNYLLEERPREDCDSKFYEARTYELRLNGENSIVITANSATVSVAARINGIDSYDFSGNVNTSEFTLLQGELLESANIAGNTYNDLFFVSHPNPDPNSQILDSIYLQRNTDLLIFRYFGKFYFKE